MLGLKVPRWIKRQTRRALYYLGKLLSLPIVRLFLFLVLAVATFPVFLFFVLRPHPQPDINYGVNFSNKYATQLGLDWRETYISILDDLRAPNLRLVAYWDEIESEKDRYDFSLIQWQLDEAQQRGVPVILVLGRKVVRYPECFEPQWWEEIDSEAARDEELYEFIKETVLALQHNDNIVMWQVENEPFFPFGDCALEIKWDVLRREVDIVRSLDDRPILVQDSGEGGLWLPTYITGDYLAISMYRRIWFDFWGLILGRPIYFQYPLAYWTYKIKADLVGVPYERILVTELQAEPWGPGINSELSREEKNKTMSRTQFIDTLNYAQKAGFRDLYFWGAEWWYFEKQVLGEPYYWDTVKALFN